MKANRSLLSALAIGAVLAVSAGGCAWMEGQRSGNGSTASAEPRGPVQTTSDASITAKVKTALAADELVKARNIDVDTVRGVVTLNGTVGSASEKERAMQIARNTSGVSQVKDNLKTGG